MASNPHIPVESWLRVVGLTEYLHLFNGFKGVEDILTFSETDILKLGVSNPAHRAKIVTSIVMLREKHPKWQKMKENQRIGPAPGQVAGHPAHYVDSVHDAIYQPFNVAQQASHHQFTQSQYTPMEIQQCLWYHGSIQRVKAERLVVQNSDFLVRDSISHLGDYVLTCFWNGQPLHFVINRQVSVDPNTGMTSSYYQFEGNLFPSVVSLVEHYRQAMKPITEASGALLSNPVTRNKLAEYFDEKAGKIVKASTGSRTPFGSPASSPRTSPTTIRRRNLNRAGSFDMLLDDKPLPKSSIVRHGSSPASETQYSLPKPNDLSLNLNDHISDIHVKTRWKRTGSEPLLSPVDTNHPEFFPETEVKQQESLIRGNKRETLYPPPKPSRIPTVRKSPEHKPIVRVRNKMLYEDDGKDYSDYEQVKSWPSSSGQTQSILRRETTVSRDSHHGSPLRKGMYKRSFDKDPSQAFDKDPEQADYDIPKSRLMDTDDYDVPRDSFYSTSSVTPRGSSVDLFPVKLPHSSITPVHTEDTSFFDLESHSSSYLTPQNKPLEASAVATMKMILLETPAKLLADHIAFLNLEFLCVLKNHDFGLGVSSGLELLTLPQGHQLRKDVLERYHCLRFFIAVITLVCTKLPERARMLALWVDVATELRSSLGDLFGFSAVMAGISCSQVTRLSNTWARLKSHHSNAAHQYDKKLSHSIKSLNDAGSVLPLQNIAVPHILPLVELLEQDLQAIESVFDLDLGAMLGHLDTARIITEQHGLYSVTARNLMKSFSPENDLLDIFRTETHMKVLFGARAVNVAPNERYPKFEQLLGVLSEKSEPSTSQTTTNGETAL